MIVPCLGSFPGSHWPHSQALTSLIPRLSLVSFPGSHWSRFQALTGLIPRLSLVSLPGSHWSRSQALTGLIPRLSLVSFPGSHWSRSQALTDLIPRLLSILQIKFVILWLHHTMGLSSLSCWKFCRLKFSHILQKSIKSFLLTFTTVQHPFHVLPCITDVLSFCDCRLTREIHKNVSTESTSIYTVHDTCTCVSLYTGIHDTCAA